MKKVFYFFVLFFFYINVAHSKSNIAYLDVQLIIDKSDLGKFYKKKISNKYDTIKLELEKKEISIKDEQILIDNQKNILKEEEIKKKIKKLNNKVINYQTLRNEYSKNILVEKKNYSIEILKILNPIITNYVEINNIDIVIEKKNILVGIKSLDITFNILEILNQKTKEKNLLNEN
tara:strand:- start:971 stop:1498 length:528 start_codon:yes stop_codon:yes gene_type:complete